MDVFAGGRLFMLAGLGGVSVGGFIWGASGNLFFGFAAGTTLAVIISSLTLIADEIIKAIKGDK